MKKILIVEDNELNRGGREGLTLAHSDSPDLILMDLGMPEVDGWQCTRLLKADPATRWIPVIALTAHAMVGEREKAHDAGCDEFDTKPIDFARLLEKMHRLFHKQRQQAS
jgi:two-component system cell cycle response regulator DivK